MPGFWAKFLDKERVPFWAFYEVGTDRTVNPIAVKVTREERITTTSPLNINTPSTRNQKGNLAKSYSRSTRNNRLYPLRNYTLSSAQFTKDGNSTLTKNNLEVPYDRLERLNRDPGKISEIQVEQNMSGDASVDLRPRPMVEALQSVPVFGDVLGLAARGVARVANAAQGKESRTAIRARAAAEAAEAAAAEARAAGQPAPSLEAQAAAAQQAAEEAAERLVEAEDRVDEFAGGPENPVDNLLLNVARVVMGMQTQAAAQEYLERRRREAAAAEAAARAAGDAVLANQWFSATGKIVQALRAAREAVGNAGTAAAGVLTAGLSAAGTAASPYVAPQTREALATAYGGEGSLRNRASGVLGAFGRNLSPQYGASSQPVNFAEGSTVVLEAQLNNGTSQAVASGVVGARDAQGRVVLTNTQFQVPLSMRLTHGPLSQAAKDGMQYLGRLLGTTLFGVTALSLSPIAALIGAGFILRRNLPTGAGLSTLFTELAEGARARAAAAGGAISTALAPAGAAIATAYGATRNAAIGTQNVRAENTRRIQTLANVYGELVKPTKELEDLATNIVQVSLKQAQTLNSSKNQRSKEEKKYKLLTDISEYYLRQSNGRIVSTVAIQRMDDLLQVIFPDQEVNGQRENQLHTLELEERDRIDFNNGGRNLNQADWESIKFIINSLRKIQYDINTALQNGDLRTQVWYNRLYSVMQRYNGVSTIIDNFIKKIKIPFEVYNDVAKMDAAALDQATLAQVIDAKYHQMRSIPQKAAQYLNPLSNTSRRVRQGLVNKTRSFGSKIKNFGYRALNATRRRLGFANTPEAIARREAREAAADASTAAEAARTARIGQYGAMRDGTSYAQVPGARVSADVRGVLNQIAARKTRNRKGRKAGRR